MSALGAPARGGAIYEVALTHRSFAYEQTERQEHNERLEFLGDAVLGIVVTDLLYRANPDVDEGVLARLRASLVNTAALAGLARSLELGKELKLGKGEANSGGRDKDSLLADTLEAVIGAVYLDRGLSTVRKRLEPLFESMLRDLREAEETYDPKTILQELVVRDGGGRPSYRLASTGPDHDKRFSAHVYIKQELCGEGEGRSKKEAEQAAARAALANVGPELRGGSDGGQDARAS